MNNIKYNPFKPLRPFQLDRLLDDVSSRSISDLFGTEFVHRAPSVNVIENDDSFEILVAAPGLAKEDFDLELDKEQLIISSKLKGEKEQEGKITRKEFNYKSFRRSFHVGDDIEKDKIGAKYKSGILAITLPKKEEIEIKKNIKIV